jgi:hypothetical protein
MLLISAPTTTTWRPGADRPPRTGECGDSACLRGDLFLVMRQPAEAVRLLEAVARLVELAPANRWVCRARAGILERQSRDADAA